MNRFFPNKMLTLRIKRNAFLACKLSTSVECISDTKRCFSMKHSNTSRGTDKLSCSNKNSLRKTRIYSLKQSLSKRANQ